MVNYKKPLQCVPIPKIKSLPMLIFIKNQPCTGTVYKVLLGAETPCVKVAWYYQLIPLLHHSTSRVFLNKDSESI